MKGDQITEHKQHRIMGSELCKINGHNVRVSNVTVSSLFIIIIVRVMVRAARYVIIATCVQYVTAIHPEALKPEALT